jgi:hypothetical protein
MWFCGVHNEIFRIAYNVPLYKTKKSCSWLLVTYTCLFKMYSSLAYFLHKHRLKVQLLHIHLELISKITFIHFCLKKLLLREIW